MEWKEELTGPQRERHVGSGHMGQATGRTHSLMNIIRAMRSSGGLIVRGEIIIWYGEKVQEINAQSREYDDCNLCIGWR